MARPVRMEGIKRLSAPLTIRVRRVNKISHDCIRFVQIPLALAIPSQSVSFAA